MTSTEPHAPRGTAGRGTQPGSRAVRWPRRSCNTRCCTKCWTQSLLGLRQMYYATFGTSLNIPEKDIWNLDTYDVVVFLRYRSSTISGVQRYRRFDLRYRSSKLNIIALRYHSHYDIIGTNSNVDTRYRRCYDVVVQNYDIRGTYL